jgi:hypothetical protein
VSTNRRTVGGKKQASEEPDHAERPKQAKPRKPRGRPAKPEANGEPLRDVWRATLDDVSDEKLQPLVDGWIYFGQHTKLIGIKSAGKSTFLAWLHGQVASSLLLTGKEESMSQSVKPRLIAHGVSPKSVTLLHASDWRLPEHLVDLVAEAKRVKARLITIDPLDSLLPDAIHENDHTGVRSFLESLSDLSAQTGAAVVSVRHPGKGAFNPFPGSRAWQTVPRRVIRFNLDSGTPPKRYLSIETDHFGLMPPPCYFHLAEEPGKPPKFEWGQVVTQAEQDVADMTADPRERRKLIDAKAFIRILLSDGHKGAGWCLIEGDKLGFSKTTMHDAANILGVTKSHAWDAGVLVHTWTPPERWPED